MDIAKTLIRHGLASREQIDATLRYRIGYKAFHVGNAFVGQSSLHAAVMPELYGLADQEISGFLGVRRDRIPGADADHASEDHRIVERGRIADIALDARESRIEHQDAEWLHVPTSAASLAGVTCGRHLGGVGHGFCGALARSNQRLSRITPSSSKRWPAICRPIGLPSLV